MKRDLGAVVMSRKWFDGGVGVAEEDGQLGAVTAVSLIGLDCLATETLGLEGAHEHAAIRPIAQK